ncbi:MAG: N-formylglutamate amidohydrolase [Pseudomonadota bacterium]
MPQNDQPFEILDGDMNCGLLLLGDHATNIVPEEYGDLGLPREQFERHIAYDIGIEPLVRSLSELLNAPAVMSRFSRLLIDPNRGADDPTLVMRISDGAIVPGNHPISADQIQDRIERFHAPYHQAIDEMIDRMIETGHRPAVLSFHSFTPSWKGVERPWHGGILWDSDPRFPKFLFERFAEHDGLVIGDNEPYDGALKNDTMYAHCTKRGLAHALIEIRQDLISDASGVDNWLEIMQSVLEPMKQKTDLYQQQFFPSRCDGPL